MGGRGGVGVGGRIGWGLLVVESLGRGGRGWGVGL